MQKIRVLIVDDSAVMRLRLKKILERDGEIQVIDIAKDGQEALRKIDAYKPQVVTMDVEMPVINGLDALRRIMDDYPLPVVMLSALTAQGTVETLKALELGAVDFIQKPGFGDGEALKQFERDLPEKIKLAARSIVRGKKKVIKNPEVLVPVKLPQIQQNHHIVLVAIGCSTGGPAALQQIIPVLPKDFPAPVVIVQHIPRGFTRPMAERLDKISNLKVVEGEDGMMIKAGQVCLAPAGSVFSLKKTGSAIEVQLDAHITRSAFKPSVDDMMLSVAEVCGEQALGVILTGMGNDGVQGLTALKRRGGRVLAESESSCVVFGMPKAAIDAGIVDQVVDISLMGQAIVRNVLNQA
ncbi:MAG: chemotaxis response regulator protein-glutamate methylesterase [Dehalobacterium sp.]